MWQRQLQRASFRALTIPVYLIIAFVRVSSYGSVLQDFKLCVSVVNDMKPRFRVEITESLIRTLVIAEDHRNFLHYGVDPVAIIRALKLRIFGGKKQGASTIEQQLVRTIVNRYEKTPRRKIREQALAVMLSHHFSKEELAATYLKVAFYGSSLVGGDGIRKIRKYHSVSSDEAIVAYLKYPKPLTGASDRALRHLNRVEHIKHLLKGDINLFLLHKRHCIVLPDVAV